MTPDAEDGAVAVTTPVPAVTTGAGWAAPFRRRGFSAYALATAGSSFSWSVSNVVFSWVTLVVTTDPLAVGAVISVRFVALLLFGIPAGVLADRVDRRLLVITVSLLGAGVAVMLAVGAAASGGTLGFEALLAGAFLLGVLDTARIAGGTAYTFDLVGPALATSGIAVTHLAAQLAGIGGNAAGGMLLGRFGLVAALAAMAVGLLSSAAVLVVGPSPPRRARAEPAAHGSLREAFTLLRRDRLLALLTLAVIVVEVLGFSSMTLLPVFARDVFEAGPDAYGVMSAVRSLGAVLGLLLLVRLGVRLTSGPVLLSFAALIGAGLLAFALSPVLWVALLSLAFAGAAMASWDSLSQSLMQRITGDAERGAAMGIWAFAVGCGPLGHLAIGAAARELGPVATQVAFAVALIAIAVGMAFLPRIRALR